MKRQPRLKALLLSAFLVAGISNIKAQDFGDILSAGLTDANTYLEAYIAPGINSFGNGLAGGWNNTAKPHKMFGFDITISANVSMIPSDEKQFSFNSRNWESLEYSGSEPLPTIVGGDYQGSQQLIIPASTTLDYGGEMITLEDEITFDVPNGVVDIESLPVTGAPVPTVNLGIGLIKNTDLKIRFLPNLEQNGFSISMFGIGVLHDIKQWIPGMKLLPFDLSGFVGFTNLSMDYVMADISNTSNSGSSSSTFTGTNMSAGFTSNATTVQVLASKKLAIFTPYIGLGLNVINSTLDVKGDFTYETSFVGPPSSSESIEFSDPVNLDFSGSGGPRLSVGGRLKLLVLTLHVEYTIQKYNMLTAGVGISVR